MTTPKPPVPSKDDLIKLSMRAVHDSDYTLSHEQTIWLAGYHARDGEVTLLTAQRDDNDELVQGLSKDKHNLRVNADKRIAELEAEVRSRTEQADLLNVEIARLGVENTRLRQRLGTSETQCRDMHRVISAQRLELYRLQRARRWDNEEHRREVAKLEAEVAELHKALFEKTDDQSWDRLWDILGKYSSSTESLSTAASRLVRMVDAVPRRTPELTERVKTAIQRLSYEHGLDETLWDALAAGVLDLVFGKERE